MIPETFIQSLLERVDVADVVGRYVQLRKGGANLLGLCPFHNEKSPSFTVSPTKQFYHCFGCGAHGSAIKFLMEHTGAAFPEAVRQLADSVGMQVPEAPRGAGGGAARAERQAEMSRHSQVLEAANTLYRRELRSATDAIDYLKRRGLSGQIAAQYGLGWANADRQGLTAAFPQYHVPEFADFLVEAGLVIQADDGRRYDRFRQRITFPIRNARGHLIGFGGRLIGPGEPKYLNSPETPVFSKGVELYGLWEARQAIRKAAQVLVVEGYMDVVALAQMGIGHAVATLGTATTAQHVQKLLRVSDRIVFSFDGDNAGRKAAWRALQACLPLLRDDVSIRFLFLPGEHDPDSYVREHGAQAFLDAAEDAMPLSRFMLGLWAEEHDLAQPEGRARCIHDAQPLMQAMPVGALRLQVVRELADMVKLTADELAPLLRLEDRPSGPLVQQERPHAARAPAPRLSTENAPPFDEAPGFDRVSADYDAEPTSFYDDVRPRSGTYRQGGYGDARRNVGGRSGRWQRGRYRDADAIPRDAPRRPVAGLPQRLLGLLMAHPGLVAELDTEAQAKLAELPAFATVCELLRVLRDSGAQHTGAVLQIVAGTPLEDELYRVAADTLLAEDLPEPVAELHDALRNILIQSMRDEMAELAQQADADPAALTRYAELARELARLRTALNT